MRKGNIYIFVILIGVIGLSAFFMSSSIGSTSAVYPRIDSAKASRNTVNFGVQPEPTPLILSLEVITGGSMDRVEIDLEQLAGARYYDPGSDVMKRVESNTSMKRVYVIEGKEAYLFEPDDEYEDYRYRTAITHQIMEGYASPTNKWQVELPNVGYRVGSFKLRAQVVNEFSHGSSVMIPLEIVYDWKGPSLMTNVHNPASSLFACPGDSVTIQAKVHDDLSGVYSVKLVEGDMNMVFGEAINTVMSREVNTSVWSVTNQIPLRVVCGYYEVGVAATDYAGNVTFDSIGIEVKPERSSFRLELKEGWNLISIPKTLMDPDVGMVFSDTSVVSIQSVVGGQRLEPDTIEPGWGYLVKATEHTEIVFEFSPDDLWAIPDVMKLKPGWNLIGYSSRTLQPAMPLTFYLGEDLKGKWVVIYTEDGAQARSKSTSPYVWATDSFPTITGVPSFTDEKENLPIFELGKAYWIYMIDEGVLVP